MIDSICSNAPNNKNCKKMQTYFVLHTLSSNFDKINSKNRPTVYGTTTDIRKRKRRDKAERATQIQGNDTQ